MRAAFFIAAGFYPSVKIGGRYYAIPSTDKRKIDLNVTECTIVNILSAAGIQARNSAVCEQRGFNY
jgi:hypothetical protein